MSILTITRLTFAEAARRRILLAALVLGLIFLLIYGLGFHFIMAEASSDSEMSLVMWNQLRNFLMMAGLYVVNFLTVMMTVLTSVDTLSGEITSGTIHTLVSKPVRRWEVTLGKWQGFAMMISIYLLLMAGGVLLLTWAIGGYLPPNPVQGLAMMWLNALILLTISLLGGTRLSTLANGVLVFGLFSISFLGGWIETIGSFLPDPATRQAAINIGVITSLILPSEALWRRAAYEMQSPLASAFGVTPFSSGSTPSLLMIAYAGLYLLVGLALALRSFQKRDL